MQMASAPILRDRRMLLLPLPLLLFLTAREFILTWSPAVRCVLTFLPPVTIMWIEPKSQNIATSFTFALNIFFGHVDASQCEAVFRNHCFAIRFGPQICNVFLTLDSSHSQPLGSDIILHPQICHMNVNLPMPCLWKMCSVAFVNGQHGLHLVHQTPQQQHSSLLTQTLPTLQHKALLLCCFLCIVSFLYPS